MTTAKRSIVRLGLFGGTFNPIHLAHLVIADQAQDQLGLDKVLFMPCAIPPHKSESDLPSAEHRLNMVKIATFDHPHFEASYLEIQRGGKSYTAETLVELSRIYHLDRENLFLIIGSDSLLELHTWRTPQRILELCQLAVIDRPGSMLPEQSSLIPYLLLPTPKLQFSASFIRDALRRGKSVRYLLPASVEEYIRANHLYGIQTTALKTR